jgi:hypothetical protein
VKDFGFKTKWDENDFPSQYRKATEDSYKKTWTIQKGYLNKASFDEQAFEALLWFVECFWSGLFIPTQAFKDQQNELLGR